MFCQDGSIIIGAEDDVRRQTGGGGFAHMPFVCNKILKINKPIIIMYNFLVNNYVNKRSQRNFTLLLIFFNFITNLS